MRGQLEESFTVFDLLRHIYYEMGDRVPGSADVDILLQEKPVSPPPAALTYAKFLDQSSERYEGQPALPKTAYQIFKQDPDVVAEIEEQVAHLPRGKDRNKEKTALFRALWVGYPGDARLMQKYVALADDDDRRYEEEITHRL